MAAKLLKRPAAIADGEPAYVYPFMIVNIKDTECAPLDPRFIIRR